MKINQERVIARKILFETSIKEGYSELLFYDEDEENNLNGEKESGFISTIIDAMIKYRYRPKKKNMKPLETKKNTIKKARYTHSWYKDKIKMLRNRRNKDYKNNQIINLS